jgi:DNA-binding IclR family transcriptional regulator
MENKLYVGYVSHTSMAKSKRKVQAVDIACDILSVLQDHDRSGITEIAEELGYAKSAIHTQLATLEDNELVVKDGTDYRLSLRFLDFAEGVKSRIDKYDVIVDEIDSLAEETGEIAQFATEEHGRLVYLHKSKGENGVETASSVGRREYLHSTSLGKSILSQFSDERVREIMDRRGMPQKTDNTVQDVEELLSELAEVRERGYALDDEENIEGLRCISAPILKDDGTVLGALSVSGPASRITDERIDAELSESISRAANVIQINYKFS